MYENSSAGQGMKVSIKLQTDMKIHYRHEWIEFKNDWKSISLKKTILPLSSWEQKNPFSALMSEIFSITSKSFVTRTLGMVIPFLVEAFLVEVQPKEREGLASFLLWIWSAPERLSISKSIFLPSIRTFLQRFIVDHSGFMFAEHPTWCFPGMTRSVYYSATCPCHSKFSLLTFSYYEVWYFFKVDSQMTDFFVRFQSFRARNSSHACC